MPHPSPRARGRSVVAAARSSLERAGISPTLHAVARWSVAASIGATGCSSAFDHDDFEPPTCSNGDWQPLVGLAPAEMRNHLAVADVGGDIGPNLVAEVGTRCADATDPAACEADFMASWQTSPSPAILSTDGGDVERWSGAPSIARFLGEIDTPQEATLLVWGDGYDVRCGNLERSAVRPLSSGGYQVIASRMTMSCDPVEITRYLIQVGGDGSLRVLEHEVYDSEDGVCVGRRPNGLLPSRRRRSAGALGDHLASIARLEASAVIAFDLLHRELAALGAPRDLLDAVDGARADEVRHARVVARLSRGHGARPRAPRVVDRPLRSALALALDNA
ncbi:MAG: hypothetical protein IT379_41215, partial [Deltaproteobacteria bacterium]|nr:hypothetical protein [Deltaproteobacteria bacterium]